MKKSTITKVGITLACVTLLGGIATPTTFSSPSDIVHAEETNQQPISVAVIAISETDGPLSHHYITINPGETKTIDAPKVEGWKLDQYTKPTYELTYDRALKIRNSSSNGFVWVQFWMIKDVAPDTPVEQPVEQPVETPAEQPVEQPVDTPAEQPVEQPVDTPAEQPVEQPAEKPTKANNTGSKAQTVATTNNKEVDNSTPAMNAIKPEGDSQTTAKTLPKTGDSSSMHLVLGGLLFGLSGLGLAAPSRKRD